MCVWGAHPLGMHIQVPSRQLDFVTTSCAAHCQGSCRDGLIRMVRGQQKMLYGDTLGCNGHTVGEKQWHDIWVKLKRYPWTSRPSGVAIKQLENKNKPLYRARGYQFSAEPIELSIVLDGMGWYHGMSEDLKHTKWVKGNSTKKTHGISWNDIWPLFFHCSILPAEYHIVVGRWYICGWFSQGFFIRCVRLWIKTVWP